MANGLSQRQRRRFKQSTRQLVNGCRTSIRSALGKRLNGPFVRRPLLRGKCAAGRANDSHAFWSGMPSESRPAPRSWLRSPGRKPVSRLSLGSRTWSCRARRANCVKRLRRPARVRGRCPSSTARPISAQSTRLSDRSWSSVRTIFRSRSTAFPAVTSRRPSRPAIR